MFAELWERVVARTITTEQGCMIWTGPTAGGHPGQRYASVGHHAYGHRLAWELHFGEIPRGLYVCHTCDNTLCVNPEHLWLGTGGENQADAVAKGRRPRGEGVWHLATLTEAQVLAIRADRRAGLTLKEIAAKHGVPYKTVDKIVYRVSWKHLP